ncbi:MAG: DHA2 family efflux MFS transporter permease subunit [Proteobacteria bacterium]|nr:DHA2 family efflux MFS transporter permease subunit [Pseudomonadota bacterium]
MPRQILIPLIVACALFMENLDSTVLATAVPAIAESFAVNPLRLNLAITSYLLSLAVFIPLSGWVADRFGARTVFRSAIVAFTIGSILCGLSQSLTGLVAARIFQGIGGAMMVPVARLVVLRSVTKAELVRAMTYLSMPALIGPIVGPPVGGFITTYLSWRWIFWINVPIGVIGVILATIFIEETREEAPPALDWRGFMLTGVGLAALVFGLEAIGRDILPASGVVALFATSIAALGTYALYARHAAYPVIDLTLLRVPTFRAGVVGGFLFRAGIGASPFLLPLMLQVGFGLDALHSGLLTFVSAVGALTMKVTAAPILRWFGFRRVLCLNALLSGAFLAVYGLFRPETPHAIILVLLLTGGFFRSLQFTSTNTIVYADVARARMSRATSFANVAQQVATTVGVAAGALLLHFTMSARGGEHLVAGDFAPAFFTIGAAAALSIFVYLQLPADAGAEMAGRLAATDTPRRLAATPDGD